MKHAFRCDTTGSEIGLASGVDAGVVCELEAREEGEGCI